MKTRKSINYAYATSPMANHLGFGKTGCYYITTATLNEDGFWGVDYALHSAEGYLSKDNPDLIAQFNETEGEVSPYSLAV
jgi:hypothetical protein